MAFADRIAPNFLTPSSRGDSPSAASRRLRTIKRGMPGTTGTFDIDGMTLNDFAADARAAAESLAHDARFFRVILLGHKLKVVARVHRGGGPVRRVHRGDAAYSGWAVRFGRRDP